MKKHGIVNSDISRVLSYMGHTDRICIGDMGLPVPDDMERIDLAVRPGLPSFMEVLTAVSEDMKIEKVVLASEIRDMNPDILDSIKALLDGMEVKPEMEFVPHERLKELTTDCKAAIRTAENTPYSNIILQSACIF